MPSDTQPIAHIMIGFIGAGKTTFARRLERETGAARFTKDEWMVRLFGNTPPPDKFADYDHRMTNLARDMALACLRAGASVIIDEGFWEREQREEIKQRVRDAGAIPRLYYLDVSFAEMKARTLRRTANPPADSFTIDEAAFDGYWTFFEPPDSDEECILVDSASAWSE